MEPLPVEMLPEQLRAWVDDASERMQCSPAIIGVPALVVLSAAVGRRNDAGGTVRPLGPYHSRSEIPAGVRGEDTSLVFPSQCATTTTTGSI